jgi:hypothetical protein
MKSYIFIGEFLHFLRLLAILHALIILFHLLFFSFLLLTLHLIFLPHEIVQLHAIQILDHLVVLVGAFHAIFMRGGNVTATKILYQTTCIIIFVVHLMHRIDYLCFCNSFFSFINMIIIGLLLIQILVGFMF